jgi:hypothetical protein
MRLVAMIPTDVQRLTPKDVLAAVWRWTKITAATLFVLWNLFFFLVRNPLDLWWSDHLKKPCEAQSWWPAVREPFSTIDNATYYYGNFCGIDQGWNMFTPELARRAPFLAARIEFTDETSVVLLSENEPTDLNCYFRFGRWRQRKLEDRLTSWTQRDMLPRTPELPLWEAYSRWSVRRWHAYKPDDTRTVARVVLLDRRIKFPAPRTDPHRFDPPATSVVAVFGPDGTFISKPENE